MPYLRHVVSTTRSYVPLIVQYTERRVITPEIRDAASLHENAPRHEIIELFSRVVSNSRFMSSCARIYYKIQYLAKSLIY